MTDANKMKTISRVQEAWGDRFVTEYDESELVMRDFPTFENGEKTTTPRECVVFQTGSYEKKWLIDRNYPGHEGKAIVESFVSCGD